MQIEPGTFHPLGATWDGRGVNFALFSENASAVELCLFDEAGGETRIAVAPRTIYVWHVYVVGCKPGQRFGWRVHGPFAPADGDRFDATKLLVDPYARLIDDAGGRPKAVVVDPSFDWAGDRPPTIPWHDTVLYELHVKGFTRKHPGVPEAIRGTYLGVSSNEAIAHLKSLGVTAVELMPVHEHMDERALVARKLTNYWGYSTLGFFAPDTRFATPGGDAIREFKEMVKALHAAGIEVVLDVVYNHSCEGDELGPTVSFRGIDNRIYYRLNPKNLAKYVDYTGCGNTLDATHPQVLKLITDSLRYWVEEMHVDGFRFDLAPALARGTDGDVDRIGSFFAVVHQDPVLSRIKLIAEPWDVGAGGYQVGNFPILWSEWNGRFRDTVRSFWRGDRGAIADMGYRLTGSSDLFADDGRHPHASINLVTAHDGFTLRDLVSYSRKHNEDNGENNRDGLDENLSQNCGTEGETTDEAVRTRRRTIAESLMGTLLLSQGIPMITMGDEMWRTQRGNNNAYCHDSELTWLDWSLGEEQKAMLEFVRKGLALRSQSRVFRHRDFLRGVAPEGSHRKDITWLRPDGQEMNLRDWANPERAAMAFRLEGDPAEEAKGAQRAPSYLVLKNGERATTTFHAPDHSLGNVWRIVIDTRAPSRVNATLHADEAIDMTPGSMVVLVETV